MWRIAWWCLVQWQISIPVVDLLSLSSREGAFGFYFSSVLEYQQEVRKGGRDIEVVICKIFSNSNKEFIIKTVI